MLKRLVPLITATAMTMSLVTVPTYSASAADGDAAIINLGENEIETNSSQLQNKTELETAIEELIKAMGYDEVYVEIGNDTVNVNVGKNYLSSTETTLIQGVVKRKTGISADKININAVTIDLDGDKSTTDLQQLQKKAEMEAAAKEMLESKGFNEAYVSIGDGTVEVLVDKDNLTDDDIALIQDIIKRKTGISADKVNISTLKSSRKNDIKVVTYPLDNGAIIFDTETGVITGAEGKFLTTVEIPEKINGVKVTEIGANAFSNCKIYFGLVLPNTITRIREGAFRNSRIRSINIPSSVREIEREAFYNTSYLEEVEFSSGVKTIGDEAFYNSGLEYLELPNSVETIGEMAFAEMRWLKSIVLYGTVGEKALFNAYHLTSVEIRGNCLSIGKRAFVGCYNLKSVNLCDGISLIDDEAFYQCKLLSDIKFSSGLKEIGVKAFYENMFLKTVVLPEGITRINPQAFSMTAISQIYIPSSLEPTESGFVNMGHFASDYSDKATIYVYYGGTKDEWKKFADRSEGLDLSYYSVTCGASQSSIKTSASNNKVGSLCLYGGISDVDYRYSESDNTLTVLTSTAMTVENYDEELILNSIDEVVSGQAVNLLAFSSDDEVASGQAVNAITFADDDVLNTRIVIAKGVDAVLTLDGVDINANSNALSLESGSLLDLILMGDNTLIGGNSSVGIDVASGAELTVDGDGSLTLSGGNGAADIDGKAVINGGNITANGDIFGFEENVIFNGGIITFSDEFVYLDDDFSGVVYVGEIGEVHGDMIISQDITLPEDTNLYIPADEATLIIAKNASITIPSTSNLTITYGGKEITITPLDCKDCVVGTYGEDGLDLRGGTVVIEGDYDLWLTCITVSDDGGVILFNEDGSIEVPAETYVEINLDDGITVGQYGGIIRSDGTVIDNVSVLLDSQGGSFIFIPPVPTGDKIEIPESPVLSNYTFDGWYKEAECLTAWDFENETANESMTLYAKWTSTSDDNTGNTPDDKTDDASSSRISRGGGRSSSAAVKNTTAETDETNTPNETSETKEPVGTTNRFTDVKDGMWYTEAVNYAVENGLFFGTSDTLFSPNAQMTRGMLATVLYRAEGQPKTEKYAFTDVPEGEWYSDAVNWAAENNIVSGFGNGLFKPNDNITREQLASILYRYAGSPATSNTELTFADTNKVSDYAKNSILWATENDIICGKDNNILDPQGEATRAEVAAMLMRYFTSTQ